MRRPRTIAFMLFLMTVTPVQAQEPGEWQCNFCTYASGWFGSVTLGTGWASEAPAKFSDYRGVDDTGLFPVLDGEVHYGDGQDRWFDLHANDLGTGRRMISARGGRAGTYQLRMAYRETVKHRGFNSASPFEGAGSASLGLPSGWVPAGEVSGFSALGTSLTAVSLKTDRKQFSTGLDLDLPGAWSLRADYHHTRKTGSRPFSAGVFTLNSSHVPAPVDFNNDRVELAVSWAEYDRQLRLAFTSSVFNNHNAALTIQNPFEPVGNTPFLRSALEPDSRFRQLTVSGAFRPLKGVKVSGSASRGTIRQDGALLPYSINPDFEHIPLPRESLVQTIDSDKLRLSSRLSARLSPRLDLTAGFKVDERDNRTPVDLYTPVITDLVQRPETPNRPYSFRREHIKTELAWRGPGHFRLRTGLTRREHERSLQSVRKTRDEEWWVEGGYDGFAAAQLRLRLENTRRDTSPYVTVNDPGLQENPLMRKFNLAAMDRSRVRFELDFMPAASVDASLGWYVSDSDYEDSVIGLKASRDESINVDLSYAPSKSLGFHLFLSREDFESQIAGAGPQAWRADTSDRFSSMGASLESQLRDDLTIGIRLVSAQSDGGIRTRGGADEAPFPLLRTHLVNARIDATYTRDEHWSWILSAELERYHSRDWQLDGLGVGGIPAILAFGQDSPDYHATLVHLQAHYRF